MLTLFVATTGFAGGRGEAEPAAPQPRQEPAPQPAPRPTDLPVLPEGDDERWSTPAEYEAETGRALPEYKEAPELAALVRSGDLPPVEQRLPNNPLVLRGFDGEIGTYGGTLEYVAQVPTPPGLVRGPASLFRARTGLFPLYGNVAEGLEMRNGGREWIITLREGLRWSDGEFFTADDIVFYYNDVTLNETITPRFPAAFSNNGEPISVEKIDDYTVRVSSQDPYHFELQRSFWFGSVRYPKHYLSQFHPAYVDEATLEANARDAGFESWVAYFTDRADTAFMNNIDRPSLAPWVVVQPSPAEPIIWQRNPYYWVVDEAGHQLPYVDEVVETITGSAETHDLKHVAGELSWSTKGAVSMYPLLKESEAEGNIRVFRWDDGQPTASQLQFNITHKDPELRAVFGDPRFRFAASHALDRNLINEAVYHGAAEPMQVAPPRGHRFYNDRLYNTAIEYDPALANSLLDEVGLDQRDSEGYRLLPSGDRLTINLLSFEMWGLFSEADALGEIVLSNLQDVGLDVNLRIVDNPLFFETVNANDHDGVLLGLTWGTEHPIFLSSNSHFTPSSGIVFWSRAWADWISSNGELGEEPSPVMQEALVAYDNARSAFDAEREEFYMQKVLDIAADNLWTIATVSKFGQIVVIDPDLRNVPSTYEAWDAGDMGRPEIYYFANN